MNKQNDSSEMPLLEHLREFRKRLIFIIATVLVGAIVSYNHSEFIFDLLSRPYFAYFPQNSLIGTGPAEAFILKIKVAVFTSFGLTLPVTFYHLWKFISPGMHDSERKLALPFIITSTVLFLTGCYLCYVLILPFTLSFFNDQYLSIKVTPQIKISEHLSLMMFAILSFGLMFETPVIFYILAKLDLVTHTTLLKGWRYAVIIIFILAAVLTPTPDVLTMMLFAMPLLALYAMSILIVKVVNKRSA